MAIVRLGLFRPTSIACGPVRFELDTQLASKRQVNDRRSRTRVEHNRERPLAANLNLCDHFLLEELEWNLRDNVLAAQQSKWQPKHSSILRLSSARLGHGHLRRMPLIRLAVLASHVL